MQFVNKFTLAKMCVDIGIYFEQKYFVSKKINFKKPTELSEGPSIFVTLVSFNPKKSSLKKGKMINLFQDC